MTTKTLLAIIAAVAAAVASWAAIKTDVSSLHRDVAEHGGQLSKISSQLETVERDARVARDLASGNQYQQAIMNQQLNLKLDYLTGDKRGPRPATTP